jgi:DNA-directed RNA polymerase subunit M/transcription elongation factor TFIIS
MSTNQSVLISASGELKRANIVLEDGILTIESVQKYFRKKETPDMIGQYNFSGKYITLFGYKKGKAGTENAFAFPPPYNTTKLYGGVIAIMSNDDDWSSPLPFTTDAWTSFTTRDTGNKRIEEEDEEDEIADESSDEEEEEEVEEEEEEDKYEDDEEDSIAVVEEDDDEIEAEPIIHKKRRNAAYNVSKIDPNIYRDELDINTPANTYILRETCLKNLQFLEETFTQSDIILLEKSILKTAFDSARKQYIPRNWKSPQFVEQYKYIARSVLSNIHPDSPVNNSRLLSRALDGEFTLDKIPEMSHYEMFPENWKALADKQVNREQKILEGHKGYATDRFACKRCHKRECSYYELQTRSADEPMTIFITCLNCGKRWRE